MTGELINHDGGGWAFRTRPCASGGSASGEKPPAPPWSSSVVVGEVTVAARAPRGPPPFVGLPLLLPPLCCCCCCWARRAAPVFVSGKAAVDRLRPHGTEGSPRLLGFAFGEVVVPSAPTEASGLCSGGAGKWPMLLLRWSASCDARKAGVDPALCRTKPS